MVFLVALCLLALADPGEPSVSRYLLSREAAARLEDYLSALGRFTQHRDAAGEPDGLEVGAIRPGTLLDQMGLANGDVLVSLNGRPLRSRLDLEQAIDDLDAVDTASLVLLRGGETRQVHYELTGQSLAEGVQQVEAVASLEPPPRIAPPPESRPEALLQPEEHVVTARARPGEPRQAVIRLEAQRQGAGNCLDAMLDRGQAQVAQVYINGAPEGFRLMALRPGSPLLELGFSQDDYIQAVNGAVLGTIEDAPPLGELAGGSGRCVYTVWREGEWIIIDKEVPR